MEIGKNVSQSDTMSFNHTNRTYQLPLSTMEATIERRNLILTQLALSPTKKGKPKEKTLNQIILETPPSELQGVLKGMGLLK